MSKHEALRIEAKCREDLLDSMREDNFQGTKFRRTAVRFIRLTEVFDPELEENLEGED